jgi:endoglycosylceramidase
MLIVMMLIPWMVKPENNGSQKLPALHTRGMSFVDASGREVILRGVNAGGRSKLPPFFPFDPVPDFNTALEKYADGIQSMGFNVVRLIIIYEAGEPVRGKYDEDYLKKHDQMVSAFAKRGVYVFVDAHQDLFSRRFCGDGFPDWTLPEKYRTRRQHADCKNWGLVDFTYPLSTTLDRFWENQDGVQDSYVAFFKMLAVRYKDEPAVIGFEPINEPFPGLKARVSISNWYKKQLFPLYEKVGQTVQSVDSRFLIFADIFPLENPMLWSTKRDRPKIKNLVFAPHYYDFGTYGMMSGSAFEKSFMNKSLRRHQVPAQKWDTPILIGEWGISPLYKGAAEYITSINSVYDDLKISHTFWEASMSPLIWNMENTSVFNPDGSVREEAQALDRPYPKAAAGTVKSFSFDPKTKNFEMTWTEDPKISAPTEIHLPERIFKSSPKVSLEPSGNFSFNPATRILRVFPLTTAGQRKITINN